MRYIVWLQHLSWIFTLVRAEVGLYRAGTDDGHSNVVPAEFLSNRVAQSVQSPFGSRISRAIWKWVLPSKRRDVDDVPSAALDHHGNKIADAVIDAAQFCIQNEVPGFGRHLVQRRAEGSDTGVVDQNIHAAEFRLYFGGEPLYGLHIGQVADRNFGSSACAGDGSMGIFQRLPGPAADHDSRSKRCQLAGNGGADSTATACDQRDLLA